MPPVLKEALCPGDPADLAKFLSCNPLPSPQDLASFLPKSPDPASCIGVLLQAGLPVSIRLPGHETLLHLACRHLWPEALEALVENGADPTAVDNAGKTPLHVLAVIPPSSPAYQLRASTRPWMARTLVSAGALLDAKDSSGNTPLHDASAACLLAGAQLLLALGADGAALNGAFQSPLHLAAQDPSCPPHLVRLLLSAGSDPFQCDMFGRTPEDVAAPAARKILACRPTSPNVIPFRRPGP